MKILYIGNLLPHSNSYLKMTALKSLNCNLICLDPFFYLYSSLNKILIIFHFKTGFIFIQKKVLRWFVKKTSEFKFNPDVIWIDSGELIGPKILEFLKKYDCPIVLLNNDDVTGKRDGLRFLTLRKSLKYFDHCFVYRSINIDEYKGLGAKNVSLINFPYDEIAHKKLDNYKDIPSLFLSEVSFVGTCIKGENRDKFIYYLIKNGLNVSIWGPRWDRSPYWKYLRNHFKGTEIYKQDYVKAIQGSKISLGFISKLNRDQSTNRSVEIPYAGGLLCAERTEKHLSMYAEGKEAVFWSTKEECLNICKKLLSNEILRNEIREAGRKRVIRDKYGNLELVKSVLEKINLIK